jgi:hypothetical protein
VQVLERAMKRRDVVVTAVCVALFAALVIPAIQAAREAARRSTCCNNVKQIGMGLQNYADTFRCYPYGTWQNQSLPVTKRFSWMLAIKPFVEAAPEPLFDLTLAWDTRANLWAKEGANGKDDYEARTESPMPDHKMFRCPGKRYVKEHWISPATYPGTAGLGLNGERLDPSEPGAGFWGAERTLSLNEVTDGLGNTLMLIETSLDNGPWTAGGRPTLRSLVLDDIPTIGKNAQFGGFHPNLCIATNADGSVRQLTSSIDSSTLEEMFTIRGGENGP